MKGWENNMRTLSNEAVVYDDEIWPLEMVKQNE